MNLETLTKIEGIIAAGEFDETGRLKAYNSMILTPVQADTTARLSGMIMTLLDTISALYEKIGNIPIAPLQSIKIEGLEYSILLVCCKKTCLGVIGKNSDVNFEDVKSKILALCE